MNDFQYWLWDTARHVQLVRPFMLSQWGWPICESVHFLGLSMLIGCIGTFDLRLMGVAKRVPPGALHKLIPWGVAGYILNVITGTMFVVSFPDQYIYNESFHWKIFFMLLAGINIAIFYSGVFQRVKTLGPGEATPPIARCIGAASLFFWTGVIVFGRMLTFFRPGICDGSVQEFLKTCFQ